MKFFRRLRALFRRSAVEADMAEEMRVHLEMQEERNRASGMSPDEARYAARRQFGGVDQIKEIARDQRGWVWLEEWGREIRFALRALRRAPGFSLAVFATMALCVGPNTAILSVLYSLAWKPLPLSQAEQLVRIYNVAAKNGGVKDQSSLQQYQDFKAHADQFSGFALAGASNATIGEESQPVRTEGLRVTTDFFTVLGINPLLGRFFLPEEQTVGRDHVIVLTRSFWEANYNADPAIVGREIQMGGESFRVIGVATSAIEQVYTMVRFYKPYDLLPPELNPQSRYYGGRRGVVLYGRLKPGVSLESGRAQLEVLERRFYDSNATPPVRTFLDHGGYQIGMGRLRDESAAAGMTTPLVLLQGGALLVLLIGCVNVINLLLARAAARRSEFAIRRALGAGLGALLRPMLVEILVLVGAAVAAGIAIAFGMLRVTNHFLPAISRAIPPVRLETQVLVMTVLGMFAIALAVGLLPFGLIRRSGLHRGTARSASGFGGAGWLGGVLVMMQVAIALVLLVGAGLLIRSFAHVMSVNPGFDATRVVQARVAVSEKNYPNPADNRALHQRILNAFREIPGTEHACVVADYGVVSRFRTIPVLLHDSTANPTASPAFAYLNIVSSEFFETMGIRILEGRGFTDSDNSLDGPFVIVDQTFATQHFPGRSAIGQEIALSQVPPPAGQPWPRIVGVAARAQLTGLEERDGIPFVYYTTGRRTGPGTYLVRSARPPAEMLSEMRSKLRAIDPTLPLYSEASLQAILDDMLMHRRAVMLLLGLFAVLALVLAAVGLYGVLAYGVSQRTREIGIRSAIGATRRQIVALILRQGLVKAGGGVAIGLGGAFYLTRFLRSQLFDVTETDPLAYLLVSGLLVAVALLACWLPARRAAKIDPAITLRAE